MSQRIPTFDTAGKPNGWLLPIWNSLENVPPGAEGFRPQQAYLTSVAPHSRKGSHLHLKRSGLFHVIKGEVKIISRRRFGSIYKIGHISQEQGLYFVPRGWVCAIYNFDDEEAILLNLPSPAWSADDPDEWPVSDWQDPEGWPPK